MEHKSKTVWLLSLLAIVLVTAVILSFAPRSEVRSAGGSDGDVKITLPVVIPEPSEEPEPTEEPAPVFDYILNTNTKRFHWPDCKSVLDIYPQNMQPFTGTRDEVIAMGYTPCGNCKP